MTVSSRSAKLKSLELQGYKTFASKAEFLFAPTITAIVGPNGSGKSNIADSIRWVLGEQSYSLLRGKKTEDMIFTGSDSKPRAGMASAQITFDNSNGWLPIDFTEVTVGRKAYRDGQNEYMINGQRVRLKDVSEMLARSGLAQRTYTIIGQGLVDAALSLKAEERRRLFEEAAGIGLYRSRREEALRRLETTRRNLERVQDILAELKPRLRSLERQAQRARDYEQVKEDLQEALRVWYGFHYHQLLSTLQNARLRAREGVSTRDDLRDAQSQCEQDLESTRAEIERLRADLQQRTNESSQLYEQREAMGRKLAVAEERQRWLGEQADLITSEIESLQADRQVLVGRIENAQTIYDAASESLREAEAARQQTIERGGFDMEERQTWVSRARSLRSSLEDLAAKRAAWETRSQQALARLAELQTQAEAVTGESGTAEQEKEQAASAAKQAEDVFRSAAAAATAADQTWRKARGEAEDVESQMKQAEAELGELRAAAAAAEARWKTIVELERGSGDAVERLISASEQGQLGGLLGLLAGQMQFDKEHESAVLAALGEFAGGLAFRTKTGLQQALDLLAGERPNGLAALLPLEPSSSLKRVKAPSAAGVVGIAADLVSTSEDYRPLVEALLSRAVVVDGRRAAAQIAPRLPEDARAITLAGEVFYPNGAVVVGRRAPVVQLASSKELEAEAAALQGKIQQTVGRMGNLEGSLGEAEQRVQVALSDLEGRREEERQAQLAWREAVLRQEQVTSHAAGIARRAQAVAAEIGTLRKSVEGLDAQREDLLPERERLESELQSVQSRLQAAESDVQVAQAESSWQMAKRNAVEAEGRLEDLGGRLEALDREIAQWQTRGEATQSEQRELAGTLDALRAGVAESETALERKTAEVAPLEESLRAAENRRTELERQESKIRADLRLAEHRHSQAQIELARREEELVSLKRRIEDDFGLVSFEGEEGSPEQAPLPIEGLVEKLPHIDLLPAEQEAAVRRLRAQLRRMGAINPEAQQEYREVRTRVEFMTSQVDDLREAEKQLQDVIAELDMLMEREFKATFEAVASAFKETFQRLFGGGSARLTLTEPDNPNDSGIEIEARLPGKREQGLAVLSGGERSLTACALVFALLQVSPTPFCVLDEVDAMLDEANVDRFRDMLRELSDATQFIVITHNRQTVQAAESVYGVSMGMDSASKVISLDLDQAEREVAA